MVFSVTGSIFFQKFAIKIVILMVENNFATIYYLRRLSKINNNNKPDLSAPFKSLASKTYQPNQVTTTTDRTLPHH